jgi:hypothetical protein
VIDIKFFEDLYFVRICDEINFEKSKKSPKKHQQGGSLADSYSHEKFIHNLEKKKFPKNLLFSF